MITPRELIGRADRLAADVQTKLAQSGLLWAGVGTGTDHRPLSCVSKTNTSFGIREIAGGAAALAGLAFAAASTLMHVETSPSLGASLAMLHQFVGSGAQAVVVFLCLSLSGLIGSQVLLITDILHKAGTGLAALGALSFAQIADTGDGGSKYGKIDAASPAGSEIQGALYLGGSIARNSDVILKAPDDTDITLNKVRWWNESLIDSPFYGARGIKWAETVPALGSMVDFTHSKATAYEQIVTQSGKVGGKPVPASGKFEDTFRKLEYTHGLNSITMNGLFRISRLHPRIRPYFGIGLGLMVPHVDAQRAGFPRKTRTLGPQITGPVFQVLGGIEWRIFVSNRVSSITEYKLALSQNEAKLKTGGTVSTNFWINQIVVGITRYLWRAAPAVN